MELILDYASTYGMHWSCPGRIIDLLETFPPEEHQRAVFIKNAIAWTQKHGEFLAGDPELQHYVGMLLWNGEWTFFKVSATLSFFFKHVHLNDNLQRRNMQMPNSIFLLVRR